MSKGETYRIPLVDCRRHLLGLNILHLGERPWEDQQILYAKEER